MTYTYDEWKKARVEAAADMMWKLNNGCDYDFKEEAKSALKAADAVPLPSDEELTEMLAKALSLSSGINDWFKDDAIASFIPDAKAAIAALRPWLATMIENGKGV